MFLAQQPSLYPTNDSKISLVCSLLTGKALEWANQGLNRTTFSDFIQWLSEAFEHSEGGRSAGEQLLALRQRRNTTAEFGLFALSLGRRVEDTLKLLFCQGLNTDMQSELACCDRVRPLDQFIDPAIRISNLLRSRGSNRFTSPLIQTDQSSDDAEPMQVELTHFSSEEHERCMRYNLCLYCGQEGYLRADCLTQSPQTHNGRFEFVDFSYSNHCLYWSAHKINISFHTTKSLLDLGAAGSFIDENLVRQHKIPLIPCDSTLAVAALDGRALGTGHVLYITTYLILQVEPLHTETTHLWAVVA